MSLESANAEWHLNKPILKKLPIQTVNWLLSEKK
jgi:hypothetical protein